MSLSGPRCHTVEAERDPAPPCEGTCLDIASHEHFRGRRVAAIDLDLLQGTLDLLVLKALKWGPRHGYAIASWIRETTDQRLQVEEGALYTSLHRMEKRGWLEADWGLSENNRKAKYYQLTTQGAKHLRTKSAVWTEYAGAVFKVLQAAV
jgi:PadR family transcriptional regulator PadR